MSKGHSLTFHSPPLLVEEKVIKDVKVVRMQHIGSTKEYIVKFNEARDRQMSLQNV